VGSQFIPPETVLLAIEIAGAVLLTLVGALFFAATLARFS